MFQLDKMSHLMEQVLYLEEEDVNADGSLPQSVCQGKPVVVMVQGKFCGYCTQAKPAFKDFANSNDDVKGVTIQMDASPGEKKAAALVTGKDKSYRGVPAYFGYGADGSYRGVHGGGRDLPSLLAFAKTLT